jgi:hypothetical protein
MAHDAEFVPETGKILNSLEEDTAVMANGPSQNARQQSNAATPHGGREPLVTGAAFRSNWRNTRQADATHGSFAVLRPILHCSAASPKRQLVRSAALRVA